MKRIVLGVIFLLGISSCKKDKELDFNGQLAKDVAAIDAYLTSRGITATKDPSGVRYTVTSVGSGAKPAPSSRVSVKYTARILNDGTVFDTSDGILLELDNLIKSWQIVLPLMTKGSVFTIYSPSGLAYGTTGTTSVPANTNLMFDVELLDDDAQLAHDKAIIDAYVDSLEQTMENPITRDPSGVAWYFATKGIGDMPISTSTITVTFTGKLLRDKSVFATQASPVSAPMLQLMDGWQIALPNIPVGSTFTMIIPSGLGYGPGGYTPPGGSKAVGPNENLIFEVKLISIS